MKINIKKLNPDAIIPTYAREWDAGADLYADNDYMIYYNDREVVSTGIAVEIPVGHVGLIHPRSGMASKYGITVLNSPGTIDAGYRGELKVILVNHTGTNYEVKRGDKIAQLVIQKVEEAEFVEVDELNETSRGNGGFGSTGA
jgi:dUTP pyrophosphatase